MNRTITPSAHYSIAQARHLDGRGAFAKAGESQADAIKRWRSADRRRWKAPEKRFFPTYKPGMSTAEYVRAYESMNRQYLKTNGFWQDLNTAPAALYEGGLLDYAVTAEDMPDLVAHPAPPVPYPARPPAEPVTADPAASVAYAARPPGEPIGADPAAPVPDPARPSAEPLTADPAALVQHPRNTRPSTRPRRARPWPRAPRWPGRPPTVRTTRRSAARGQPIGSSWPTGCSPGRCPAPDRAQPRRLRCAAPGQPLPARRAGRHRPPARPMGRAPPWVSRPVRTEKLQPLEVRAFPVEPA